MANNEAKTAQAIEGFKDCIRSLNASIKSQLSADSINFDRALSFEEIVTYCVGTVKQRSASKRYNTKRNEIMKELNQISKRTGRSIEQLIELGRKA